MSLLTPTPAVVIPPAQRKADALREHIRGTARVLVARWAQGFDLLWNRTDPGATLKALGTDAAECFARSAGMCEFCISQFGADHPVIVAEVLPRLASLPEFEIHDDGTVTATIPEPEPVEEEMIDLEADA